MKINITKNKTLSIIGAVALVLIIWIVIDNSRKDSPAKNKALSEKNSQKVAEKANIQPEEKKSIPSENNTSSKYIKGLLPSDVYGNMNLRGFKTEQFLETGMGYTWVSKLSKDGFDYEVTAWSENDNMKVQTVKASVICNPPCNILETITVFQMVSTLPYDNAQPQTAASWVFDYFEENEVSTLIGGVKFTLITKSENEKMLLMENAE